MWQRYKLYLLAFVIYTLATAALAALEVLAVYLGDNALLARLVTMLSGSFLGGFALVLGILKDDRYEKERQRAEKAEAAIADWQKRAIAAEKRAEQAELEFRQQAEHERANAYAEVQRVRDEYTRETAARLFRLETAVGIATAMAADAAANPTDPPTEQ